MIKLNRVKAGVVAAIVFCILAGSALTSLAWTNKLYYTKKNWPACLTRQDLDRVVEYQNQKDLQSIQHLLDTQRCLLIKEDLPVFVENVSIGVIKVRPKGMPLELYMYREAIK